MQVSASSPAKVLQANESQRKLFRAITVPARKVVVMTAADKWIRGSTIAAVVIVAAVAAGFSYQHALEVSVRTAGPPD